MDKNTLAVNTYNKIADIYTRKYFKDTSDFPFIDKFLDIIPSGSKILDIGCGPGSSAKYILKKGYFVEGIDLSENMLNIAKKKAPNVIFKQMDMRKLNYPDNSCDGILCAYSLIHIPSKEVKKTLKGFYRILKPQGKLLLITQKGESDKIVDEPLKEGLQIFINFFSKEQISDLLKKAAFKVILQKETIANDQNDLSDTIIYTIAEKRKQ